MNLKTPLRYPGGKSRAVKKMVQYFPSFNEYTEFHELFLGGGSVSNIHLHRCILIWISGQMICMNHYILFWRQLQLSGDKLRNELVQLKQKYPDPSSARNLFLDSKEYLQKSEWDSEPFHKAVAFYVVNKCSF